MIISTYNVVLKAQLGINKYKPEILPEMKCTLGINIGEIKGVLRLLEDHLDYNNT